ncbi:hypothetical protein CC80DRAFT_451679 [Byssothecium circinans]|uniref:NB-ARC domain-containing protein n=1 Tax=Byssothecium circinans TaxID=147558 RepID=A0A6A5TKG3_9PLEO|nr:hypothetical protein CC80DRAFT_451679 [Byssothecium circinans]
MVPRPVSRLFTGRSELLCRIKNAFQADRNMQTEEQKRLVIVGMGGQGKSEVCLKAASIMREDFWGVFWVDVGRREMAKNGFIAVAKALGSSAESIAESLHALASTKRRWLLILDNADDPDFDYKDYIPSGSNGAVMMTSRVQQCEWYSTIKHETLDGLDLEPCTQLLLKTAKIGETLWSLHEQQAQDIVHLLGSHTLALIQAGAYIAEGYCRLDQYPKKYQQQRKRLLKHFPNQEQSRYRNVYATFEASAEVLTGESGQDALDLLAILSMVHSNVLPLQVFEDAWRGSKRALKIDSAKTDKVDALGQWHVSELPGLLGGQGDEWDDYCLMVAISRLASLSLVTRHRSDDFDGLSMHSLAHTWAKDRLSKGQQQQAWTSAGCVLALSREQSKTWQVYEKELRPHVQSYLSPRIRDIFSYGPQTMMLPIILKCGWALHTMREDARLESLLEDIYQTLQITPLEPSRAHLPIWNLAGSNQVNMGHSRRAVALLEHVVKVQETTLAETHPNRLASQHTLASAYRANGQTKEAVALLEHVVKVQETTLAETHPNRLASQHTLASAYRANGQTKEAVALLEHVVKVHKTTLAETHPHRLASQHELAIVYKAEGQEQRAIELLEQVVTVKIRVYRADHPSRRVSERVLARWRQFRK